MTIEIEQLQRRVHALAEETRRLARHDLAGFDIADRRLVADYAEDARAALDELERRLGLGARRGRFVVLEEEGV